MSILSGDSDDVIGCCVEWGADFLAIEVDPEAGDYERDVTSRCDMAIALRERLPECKVHLLCRSTYARLAPAMEKARELNLIDGYLLSDPEEWAGQLKENL